MRYILVYGTLRRNALNNWNYQRFGPHLFIENITLPNYAMFALSHYPTVCPSDNPGDKIVCELQEVENNVYNMIEAMEHGAGYEKVSVDINTISKNNITASLFVWPQDRIKKYGLKKIESGDWAAPISPQSQLL